MSLSNLTTAGLESLISLVKKRDALKLEIAKIEKELSEAFTGASVSTPAKVSVPAAKPIRRRGRKAKVAPVAKVAAKPVVATVKSAAPAKKGKRGALKESVLAALTAAGPAGIAVKDLSAKLGIKNQNLHVWFSTTGKTVKGLKKTKAGTWAYAG